jgi:uncharacterized phage protein (TIGR01671 family)
MKFKFRVWDKKFNYMRDHNCLSSASVRYDALFKEREDLSVMQFTGLKDKNGIELYDQDIIQTDQGTLFIIEFNQQEMQWVLYQANEGSRRDLQGEVFALKAYMVPNITLKGNCYQNPDLLKP